MAGLSRAGGALLARAPARQIPVQPAVRRALVVRRPALHVVLRIEVRTRVARTTDGVHRRENAAVPELLHWLERRMQAKEAVEIDGSLRRPRHGPRNGDGWPHPVVRGFAMGH